MDDERTDIVLDLPENCHYRDEGCDLADSCFNCPFPDCVFDKRGGEHRRNKKLRNKEICRLYIAGFSSQAIADKFQVCRRTVQRAITSRFKIKDLI